MVNPLAKGKGFFQGIQFFLRGIGLIFKPGLKRYIVIPIIFNAILLGSIFAGLAFFLYHLNPFWADYPKWLIIIFGWLFWLLYSLMSLLVSSLVFTFLTNTIASPFYGLLAEAAAEQIAKDNRFILLPAPDLPSSNQSWLSTAFLIAPRTLAREGRKWLYFLPWLLLCGLFLVFPFAWAFFPIVWWLVLAWVLAIQYIDYQPDNQRIPFKEVMTVLKQNCLTVFGFGTVVSVAMLIPGANLFVPPAAVAGGTVLWLSLQMKKNLE